MGERAATDKRQRWALPMLISTAVNLVFIGSLLHLFSTPVPRSGEIAVELAAPAMEAPRPVSARRLTPLPSPKPEPAPIRTNMPIPAPGTPSPAPSARPQAAATGQTASPASGTPAPGPASPFPGPENGSGTGMELGTGPGEAVAGGPGGGGSRGEGTHVGVPEGIPGGSGTAPGRGSGRSVVQQPHPVPVPPSPKGETRGIRILKETKPAYPASAREDEAEGTSTILVAIDEKGNPVGVRLEKSSGDSRLDRAAEKAVRQWTYAPALKEGIPTSSTLRVKVQFRLE